MANEIDKDALDNAILKKEKECTKTFRTQESCEGRMISLWEFARSRAHKGMTWVVVGLLAGIISLGAVQTRWLVGMSGVNSEKIHKLEIDTALQLKELQAQQGIIIQGISELNENIRVLTEKMIPE